MSELLVRHKTYVACNKMRQLKRLPATIAHMNMIPECKVCILTMNKHGTGYQINYVLIINWMYMYMVNRRYTEGIIIMVVVHISHPCKDDT